MFHSNFLRRQRTAPAAEQENGKEEKGRGGKKKKSYAPAFLRSRPASAPLALARRRQEKKTIRGRKGREREGGKGERKGKEGGGPRCFREPSLFMAVSIFARQRPVEQ